MGCDPIDGKLSIVKAVAFLWGGVSGIRALPRGAKSAGKMARATDIANCQMLCKTHNRAKGNR